MKQVEQATELENHLVDDVSPMSDQCTSPINSHISTPESSLTQLVVGAKAKKKEENKNKTEPKEATTFNNVALIKKQHHLRTANNNLGANLKDRNSLESISSKFSNSSANDYSSASQNNSNNNNNNDRATTTTTSSSSQTTTPTIENVLPITNDKTKLTKKNSTSSSLSGTKRSASKYVSPPSSVNNLQAWQDAASDRKEAQVGAKFSLEASANNKPEVAMICLNGQKLDQSANREVKIIADDSSYKDNEIAIIEPTGAGSRRPTRNFPYRAGSRASSRVSIVVPTLVEKKDGPPFPFAGVVASLLGSICFSFSVVLYRFLPDQVSIAEKAKVLWFRGFFILIFCVAASIYNKASLKVPRDEIWINALRAVFGTLGIFGTYCALTYISAGDSTAIIFSSPIWTSILAHFIFKEPLQILQLVALPVSLFGIILIAHPALILDVDHSPAPVPLTHHHLLPIKQLDNITATTNSNATHDHLLAILPETTGTDAFGDWEQRWPGIAIALGVSFLVSCTYIVLKFRRTTPIQTTTFWLGVCLMITSIGVMFAIGFGDMPNSTYEWSILLGLGITSWLGQSFLQWAFLHEEAGRLSVLRTADVALTFCFSALLLDDEIYWTSIVGALIISSVVVSIIVGDWVQRNACMSNAGDDDIVQVESNENITAKIPKQLISATAYTISKAS